MELCIPVLGIFALVCLFNDSKANEEKLKALKITTIITASLAVVFLLFKSVLFDFEGLRDDQYIEAYGRPFINAVIEDRMSLFTTDTIRTLILVLLSAGAIYLFLKKKLSENLTVVVFAVLILFDLVTVDRQYVNNDDFISAIRVDRPYQATAADKEILKDKAHFRVLDMSSQGQSQPGRAAYFHNSLFGYHAAKLGRYNDLMEFHIYNNNMNVLNMLNTKYIIAEEQGQVFPYTNTDANGNAWFVSSLKQVENANKEIKLLDSLDTKNETITTQSTAEKSKTFIIDSTASITLKEFKPNYLKYESNNSNDGFAVFSEIYYGEGWSAYVDGELMPYIRVNYVLRGMEVPKGSHIIEFKFEPEVVETGSKIALASSAVFGILLLLGIYYGFKIKREE